MPKTKKTVEKQTHEAKIPPYRMEEFDKLIEKLNRKCKRYGLAPITVEKGKVELELIEVPCNNPYEEIWNDTVRIRSGGVRTKQVKYEYVPVTVIFEELRIKGGWRVLGTVERTDTEYNVINGKVEDIGDYKKYDLSHCDHCNTRRYRRSVFIIENDKGKRQVVGRQCVKDYLGVSVAAAVFSCDLWKDIAKAFEDCEFDEGEFFGGNGPRQVKHHDLIELAILTVHILKENRWGFRGKKYWDEYCNWIPTSMEVRNLYAELNYNTRSKLTQEDKDEIFSTDNQKLAKKFLKEAQKEYPEKSLETLDNSFEYDFALILHCGYVMERKMGFFTGMFGWRVAKAMEHLKEKKHNPKDSEYVGEVGEKMKNVELTLKKTQTIDGYYGTSLMVVGYFGDTPNQFVTFFSGRDDFLFDGDMLKEKINASFTVKKHQDRGYGKQTMLTRLRLAK